MWRSTVQYHQRKRSSKRCLRHPRSVRDAVKIWTSPTRTRHSQWSLVPWPNWSTACRTSSSPINPKGTPFDSNRFRKRWNICVRRRRRHRRNYSSDFSRRPWRRKRWKKTPIWKINWSPRVFSLDRKQHGSRNDRSISMKTSLRSKFHAERRRSEANEFLL